MQSMQVRTLQILETRFKPEDARAIAEAIDNEVNPSRFVTDETLKFRLGESESRLREQIGGVESSLKLQMAQLEGGLARLETRLTNKMIAFGLTGAGLIISIILLKK